MPNKITDKYQLELYEHKQKFKSTINKINEIEYNIYNNFYSDRDLDNKSVRCIIGRNNLKISTLYETKQKIKDVFLD